MERRIEIERTLIIGDARVSSGTEAFIKFMDPEDNQYGRWMFATCVRLNDCSALFQAANGDYIRLWPEEILKVTDKLELDVPTDYSERLLAGEVIICKVEESDEFDFGSEQNGLLCSDHEDQ